tara:strand:- start:4591 stop:5280 length:690 start_codon:yes stop_codon:yes gene_type:complete
MGWFSAPDPIDPNKVYDMMTSDYMGELDQMAAGLMDPNSSYNQGVLQQALQSTEDSAYTQNRINRMNMAATGMGNQSGIMQGMNNQNVGNITGMAYQNWLKQAGMNTQQAIGIKQGNMSADMTARDAMASAYGQNITNKNNYNSAMAGNVMNLATTAMTMCDAKMKENIKKKGNIKLKNGKKTGIYEFNYKGRKKKHVNVMAQEVRKHLPEAVVKGKNGLLYVDWNKMV